MVYSVKFRILRLLLDPGYLLLTLSLVRSEKLISFVFWFCLWSNAETEELNSVHRFSMLVLQ